MKSEKQKTFLTRSRIRFIIAAVAVVVIIALVVGIAIYRDYVAPFSRVMLEVDDTSISMRYFLQRIVISGAQATAVLDTLIREQVIKLVAPNPPYNIQIGEEEIDRFLRNMAKGASESITDSEYGEWYRQQLNESRFSSTEFRDLARTGLLSVQLNEYLARTSPTVSEQVYLHMLPVKDLDVARKAKARLDAGEGFATLAHELSTNEELRKNGGDLGWFPRNGLSSNIAQVAFDELNIGEFSEPIALIKEGFVILMVSEKAAARKVEEVARQSVTARALDVWFLEEIRHHQIEFHGLNNGGYDSKTDAWVYRQVEEMKKERARRTE